MLFSATTFSILFYFEFKFCSTSTTEHTIFSKHLQIPSFVFPSSPSHYTPIIPGFPPLPASIYSCNSTISPILAALHHHQPFHYFVSWLLLPFLCYLREHLQAQIHNNLIILFSFAGFEAMKPQPLQLLMLSHMCPVCRAQPKRPEFLFIRSSPPAPRRLYCLHSPSASLCPDPAMTTRPHVDSISPPGSYC